MNGYLWRVLFVNPTDLMLVDRTGTRCVATTDPISQTIYLSNELYGSFLTRVLIHELGHCAMCSYNLLPYIHKLVRPAYWIQAEEWLCNFITDYGLTILRTAEELTGQDALNYLVDGIDALMA